MHMIQWGLSAPEQTTFPYLPLHTWEFIAKLHSPKQLLCPSTLRQNLPFQGKLSSSPDTVSNPSRPVLGLSAAPSPLCMVSSALMALMGNASRHCSGQGCTNPLINLNETQNNPEIPAPFLATIFCRFWTAPTYTITLSTPHCGVTCCRAELDSTGQGRAVNCRMGLVQPSSCWVEHHCPVCSHGTAQEPPRNASFSSFLTPQPYGHEKHLLRLIQRRNEYSPVVTALLNDREASPHCLEEQKGDFDKLKSEAICQLFPLFLPTLALCMSPWWKRKSHNWPWI